MEAIIFRLTKCGSNIEKNYIIFKRIYTNIATEQVFTSQFLKTLPFNLHIHFKGIVSRDFCGLQMILTEIIGVPDVPLEVYSFLNFCTYTYW